MPSSERQASIKARNRIWGHEQSLGVRDIVMGIVQFGERGEVNEIIEQFYT